MVAAAALALATAFVPTMQVGDAVPAIRLVDQSGRALSLQTFRGTTLVVSFIYTRCRDARECPLISAKFQQLQARFRGTPIHLVELTLDPAYDRPGVLRRYGAAFGADPARWTLATGRPEDLRELDERLGVVIGAHESSGQIAHTESLVFVDRAGRIADRIEGASWNVDDIAARAQALSDLQSDPIALVRLALSRGVNAFCGGGVAGISLGAALVLFTAILAILGVGVARAFRFSVK